MAQLENKQAGLPLEVGQFVRSKAGRDRGDVFLVLELLEGDQVMIVDGHRRPLDRPKKKKVKHLQACKRRVADFEAVKKDPEFNDARVRALIKTYKRQ